MTLSHTFGTHHSNNSKRMWILSKSSFSTLTGLAPGTLDTLQEIASAIQALQTRATNLETVTHPSGDHFGHSSNLTKVLNPLRGSKIEVGNNIQLRSCYWLSGSD